MILTVDCESNEAKKLSGEEEGEASSHPIRIHSRDQNVCAGGKVDGDSQELCNYNYQLRLERLSGFVVELT